MCSQPGPAAAAKPKAKEENDAEDDNKFDEFMGSDSALLAGTTGEYDRDDKEADDVWEAVDTFMDGRRRVSAIAKTCRMMCSPLPASSMDG